MQTRAVPALVPWLVCSVLLPAAALATTRTQLWVNPSFSGGIGPYSEALVGVGPLSLAGSGGDGELSSGAGTSFTDYGVIRMVGAFGGSGTTGARGSFHDSIVFQAPGLMPGTSVEVDYAVWLGGSLAVDPAPGNAVSQWTVRMDLNGGSIDASYNGQLWNDSPSHVNAGKVGYIGDPFGWQVATAVVQIGASEAMGIALEALAQVTFQNGAPRAQTRAAFDLGSSLYWGGILGMRHTGVEITEFSAVGNTGIDWRQSMVPVPEPASWLLLAAGLALGVWRRCTTGQPALSHRR